VLFASTVVAPHALGEEAFQSGWTVRSSVATMTSSASDFHAVPSTFWLRTVGVSGEVGGPDDLAPARKVAGEILDAFREQPDPRRQLRWAEIGREVLVERLCRLTASGATAAM